MVSRAYVHVCRLPFLVREASKRLNALLWGDFPANVEACIARFLFAYEYGDPYAERGLWWIAEAAAARLSEPVVALCATRAPGLMNALRYCTSMIRARLRKTPTLSSARIETLALRDTNLVGSLQRRKCAVFLSSHGFCMLYSPFIIPVLPPKRSSDQGHIRVGSSSPPLPPTTQVLIICAGWRAFTPHKGRIACLVVLLVGTHEEVT